MLVGFWGGGVGAPDSLQAAFSSQGEVHLDTIKCGRGFSHHLLSPTQAGNHLCWEPLARDWTHGLLADNQAGVGVGDNFL